jgi:hypothetical protein
VLGVMLAAGEENGILDYLMEKAPEEEEERVACNAPLNGRTVSRFVQP